MKETLTPIKEALGIELFKIGSTTVSVSTLITVVLVLAVTVVLSRRLRRIAEKLLLARGGRPGMVGTVSGLIHYGVLVTGFGVALSTAGIDLTALFAAGAIFAVGLGFAMQSIAQNFVAGVILLAERAIKPGDVIEVEGTTVRIRDMGIRASIGETRDGVTLIIPNSALIQSVAKNFTFKEHALRVRIQVGVTYGSDMKAVRDTLEEVARKASEEWGARKGRDPQVLLTAFGDNSVNWEVGVWIPEPWDMKVALSRLRETTWWALKDKDITIAFPQLDVHLDEPVVESLRRLGGRAA